MTQNVAYPRFALAFAIAVAVFVASTHPLAQQGPLPAQLTGTLTSATCAGTPGNGTGCLTLNVTGFANLSIQVSGTFVGTIGFQVSNDGVTYTALKLTPPNSAVPISSTTTVGLWAGSVASYQYAQVLMTAYTSGTATVTMQTTTAGVAPGASLTGGSFIPLSSDGTAALVNVNNASGAMLGVAGSTMTVTGAVSGVGGELDNNFGLFAAGASGAYASALFTIDTSAASYTAVFEALGPSGNWAGITVYDNGLNPIRSTSGSGLWTGNVAGFKAARIRMSAFSGKSGPNAAITVSPISTIVSVSNSSPCEVPTPTTVPISFASATVQKVITNASGLRNYICSIVLVAGAAEIVNIWEGTKTTNECDTGTVAVAGSTTAAQGLSLAANGHLDLIGGKGAAIPGIGLSVDTCLATNGANRIAGYLTYVQR